MSIGTLVCFLLAMFMEIWGCECGRFGPFFVVFPLLGQVGNTISLWDKGPSEDGVAIFVAYNPGSIALELGICSSGLAGVMQLTVRGTLPNFAFLAVFCPIA